MEPRSCLIAVLMALAPPPAAAPVVYQDRHMAGHFYEIGGGGGAPLFRWEMSLDDRAWRSRYFELDGDLTVEDALLWENGQLESYAYVRHLSGERSRVRLDRGEVHYARELDGDLREEHRSLEPDFLVGPAVIPFIHEHWDELVAGGESTSTSTPRAVRSGRSSAAPSSSGRRRAGSSPSTRSS